MSHERLALPISDLLRARAHWRDPKASVTTAEAICRMLGRDPHEIVDTDALFDVEDDDA